MNIMYKDNICVIQCDMEQAETMLSGAIVSTQYEATAMNQKGYRGIGNSLYKKIEVYEEELEKIRIFKLESSISE